MGADPKSEIFVHVHPPGNFLLGRGSKHSSRQNDLADWHLLASVIGYPRAGLMGSWKKWLRWQRWAYTWSHKQVLSNHQGWCRDCLCPMSNLPATENFRTSKDGSTPWGDWLTTDDKLTAMEAFILAPLVICSHRSRHTFRCGWLFCEPLIYRVLIYQHGILHCIGPGSHVTKKQVEKGTCDHKIHSWHHVLHHQEAVNISEIWMFWWKSSWNTKLQAQYVGMRQYLPGHQVYICMYKN